MPTKASYTPEILLPLPFRVEGIPGLEVRELTWEEWDILTAEEPQPCAQQAPSLLELR